MELECRESNLFDEMQAATDGFGERQTAKRSESLVERFSRCEHFLNTVKNGYKKAKLLNDQEQTFSMTTKLGNTSLSGHARIARK